LTHNIAIKRYCNKKDIFEPQVSFGQGKLLAQGTFHSFLSLSWLGKKTYGSKYIFIVMSFYLFIAILFAKMSRVNMVLIG